MPVLHVFSFLTDAADNDGLHHQLHNLEAELALHQTRYDAQQVQIETLRLELAGSEERMQSLRKRLEVALQEKVEAVSHRNTTQVTSEKQLATLHIKLEAEVTARRWREKYADVCLTPRVALFSSQCMFFCCQCMCVLGSFLPLNASHNNHSYLDNANQ